MHADHRNHFSPTHLHLLHPRHLSPSFPLTSFRWGGERGGGGASVLVSNGTRGTWEKGGRGWEKALWSHRGIFLIH
jgi:hypothetical protein